MQLFLIKAIRFYQKIFSFDKGYMKIIRPRGISVCRFYPTCSDYGIYTIEKHGVIKGSLFTLFRLLRCNPFNKYGDRFDPVK